MGAKNRKKFQTSYKKCPSLKYLYLATTNNELKHAPFDMFKIRVSFCGRGRTFVSTL